MIEIEIIEDQEFRMSSQMGKAFVAIIGCAQAHYSGTAAQPTLPPTRKTTTTTTIPKAASSVGRFSAGEPTRRGPRLSSTLVWGLAGEGCSGSNHFITIIVVVP